MPTAHRTVNYGDIEIPGAATYLRDHLSVAMHDALDRHQPWQSTRDSNSTLIRVLISVKQTCRKLPNLNKAITGT